MSTAAVRAATVADAGEIARIQRETWRIAYAGLLGAQALDDLDAANTEREWAGAIEHPGTSVHLATEGSATVGFCVAGPAPESEIAKADGELPEDAGTVGLIATVLVEPRWSRRGHGGRLLVAAGASLRAEGVERGVTWVVQSDHASLGFFRRAGWRPDGTVRTLDTGQTMVREVRLTGPLEWELVD